MTLLAEGVDHVRVVVTDGRRAPRRPDRAGQTIHRIVAGNIVILMALIAVGYVLGSRMAEQQALSDASRLTTFVAHSVVKPHLDYGVLHLAEGSTGELDRLFRTGVEPTTSIARIKVWRADGTVLYSDEATEIGDQFPLEADELALLDGATAATATAGVSELEDEENAADRALGTRVLEVYVPLVVNHETYLFEAYIDYEELRDRREAVFGSLALLASVLVVLLLLAQWWLGHANLRWLRRRQSDLDRAAAEISDRERRRVVRDLHDGAVQELLGMNFLVDGAVASLQRGDDDAAHRSLDQCRTSIGSAVQSLRSTIVEVYPPVLADRGLAAALEDLAQPLRSRGTEVEVTVTGEDELDDATTTACYRAAQELLRNVRRHAVASRAAVVVEVLDDRVRLTVADDGVGVDPERLTERDGSDGHLGLAALADTALELDGTLVVTTTPGHGTEITWEVRR